MLQPEAKQRPARKRKTDVKFVVVPAHKCQLLDDPLANACMYGGLEGAQTPDCRGARLSVVLALFAPCSQPECRHATSVFLLPASCSTGLMHHHAQPGCAQAFIADTRCCVDAVTMALAAAC